MAGGAKEAERNIAKQSRDTFTSSKMGGERKERENERGKDRNTTGTHDAAHRRIWSLEVNAPKERHDNR